MYDKRNRWKKLNEIKNRPDIKLANGKIENKLLASQ